MTIWLAWIVYVLIGTLWLYQFSKKNEVNNIIATLYIITLWPIFIVYDLFKRN